MVLVDNDVDFDGEYIVVLKLWAKCIFCLTQNLSEKGA